MYSDDRSDGHGQIVSFARGRKDLVELAGMAEQAERYQDMAECMKAVVQMGGELSLQERNLFSVAYKNLVGARRSEWRALSAIEQKVDGLSNQLARQYRERVAMEIRAVCSEALDLVQKQLEPHAPQAEPHAPQAKPHAPQAEPHAPQAEPHAPQAEPHATLAEPHATLAESRMFYAKMIGDYNRYLAEITTSSEEQQRQYSDASKAAYDKAMAVGRTGLPSTHPIRLGLSLSFAVFSYEILNDHERAVQIAKAAFDEAISDLDSLSEDNYKDSTLILQLLRDNLTQWTASSVDATK